MASLADEDRIVYQEVCAQLTAISENLCLPKPNEKVHKNECIYCFRNPFFPGGLYVCLTQYVGVCSKHISNYANKTGFAAFLNIKNEKVETQKDEEPLDKIPKIDHNKEDKKLYSVCLYPYIDIEIPVELDVLGEKLLSIINQIIAHLSADVQSKLDSGACDWEGTALLETSVVNNLLQLDVIKTEPLSGWICEEPGCTFQKNLWLNLSDGAVMCGRGQVALDGNSHALKHARETGFCLVVRLGTIQNGTGEVFLYDFQDDKNEGFVKNPNLKKHLAHFGLNINSFQKTEQNFLEMEKSFQFKHDWNVIQEEGLNLEQKFGHGFTGLVNMGSTCYMNSVLQSLLAIPDFVNLYDKEIFSIFDSKNILDTYDDLNCQLAKVLHSLNSTDDFSKENSKLNGIEPKQFREVAGKGHFEFSTAKQQDVEHYIRHLFELIDKFAPADTNPVNATRFKLVERFEDIASGQVRYSTHDDVILSLSIPVEVLKPILKPIQVDEEERNTIMLEQCLSKTFGDDIIEDYISPITNERKGAKQSIRLGSFPDFLFVQLKRFTYDITGEQRKLNVDIDNVDQLVLEVFRSTGLQLNEVELSEDVKPPTKIQLNSDKAANETLNELLAMGFGENASRKAIRFTNNESVQVATEWIIQRMNDPTLNDPEPDILVSQPCLSNIELEEAINKLVEEFQFTPYQAKYGLNQTNGKLNEAVNWLFENIDKIPIKDTELSSSNNLLQSTSDVTPETSVRDGKGIYRLRGFISHIGKNPHCGHYVVHLKKDDIWYIYNDEKVCISKKPPKACGYVYLYEREK